MVVLNKIYTRTGDAGQTSLGSGQRVAKYDIRVAAYGTVDETNAALGVAIAALRSEPAPIAATVLPMLTRIQNDLFDLGADLCVPERADAAAAASGSERGRLAVTEAQVTRLENEIDLLNADLSPLRSFILPGGSMAAAHLHVARTVCRRAERLICELAETPEEMVAAPALKYINRLSDFLFVVSRSVNDGGKADILWVAGQNR
jgi:cob(I)alamin adenosyltransferase